MALKELRETVLGEEIFARQWPATKGLEMQIELLNTCGGHIIPIIQGDYSFDDIIRLMAHTNKKDLTDIVKRFVYDVTMNGEVLTETNINFKFAGNLLGLVQVFCKTVELQYRDFFEQGRATFPKKSK